MVSKKELEIILSKLKGNPEPKPSLEQYIIPSHLAAEILNLACLSGIIKNKTIADFGCETGVLAIGAQLLGAKEIIAVDIDENVLRIAKDNANFAGKMSSNKTEIKFVNADISEWDGKVDTVIQNPPFGIQKRHADRIFLEKALESAENIYSLHRSYEKSRDFIKNFVERRNGKVKNITTYKFRIPHMFRFHRRPKVEFDVDLFDIEVK